MAINLLERAVPVRVIRFAAAMTLLLWSPSGWAQNEVQAKFEPSIEQKVDARTAPAKGTTDDANTLTGKGYVEIGTIHASRPGKSASAEATQQLKSAVLQKAAQAGADVVRFSREGAPETIEVPTGKTKIVGATCDEYSTQAISTSTSSQSCYTDVHGFSHCMTWTTPTGFRTVSRCAHASGGTAVPVTKREESLVSEGTVWRYDPKLAADIAARAAEAVRDAQGARDLWAMLQAGDVTRAKAVLNADPRVARETMTARRRYTELSESGSTPRPWWSRSWQKGLTSTPGTIRA